MEYCILMHINIIILILKCSYQNMKKLYNLIQNLTLFNVNIFQSFSYVVKVFILYKSL